MKSKGQPRNHVIGACLAVILVASAAWGVWIVSPRVASAEEPPKQEGVGPQSDQLKVLIARFEEAEYGDKWLAMQKVYNVGTPEAFAYLCHFAEDPKQPVNDRLNAMLLLKPLATEEPGRIRSTFLRLLDDPQPRAVEEAAVYLSGLATADAIEALEKRWPADRPPAWATMAGLRLIRHMDSPAVKEAFQERIEAPGMSFTKHGVVDLSEWSAIPPKYRARLLGFIKSRPLDRRRLVWLAARSAAATGSVDALNFLCDRLVVDWPIPSFDFGYVELQIMQRMLGKHRALASSDEEAARARKIAGDSPTCPVLKNQGRLFVLLDRGHPAVDGYFRITVIDAKSHKAIKSVGYVPSPGIPVALKRLDNPHQAADNPVSASQDSTPWPTKLEAFSYLYMPTALGSKMDVGMDRSGRVSYSFQSQPHTGSGGQTVSKEWRISREDAEQILDSLVSTGILDLGMDGAAKYPLHYFEFASKGWQKKIRPVRLPDSVWKQMLPLMIRAHPEMWQENTQPNAPAEAETTVPPKPVQAQPKKYEIFYDKETKNLKAKAPVLVRGPLGSFGFTPLSQQIDMALRMNKHPGWHTRWTPEAETELMYRGKQLRVVDRLTVDDVQRDGNQIRVLCRRTISTDKERFAAPYLPVVVVVLGKLPAGKYQVQWIVKTYHPGDKERPDGSAGATPASEKPETLQHSFTVEPATEGADVRPPAAAEEKASRPEKLEASPESRWQFYEALRRSRGTARAIAPAALISSEGELQHRLRGGEATMQISTPTLMNKVGWRGWCAEGCNTLVVEGEWSEAVGGLQCRLYVAPHDPVKTRPVDALTFEIRNVTDRPITVPVWGPGNARLMLAVTVESYPELKSPHFISDTLISPLVLQPGQTFAFRVSGQYQVAWSGHRDGEVVLFDPAGKTYQLRVTMDPGVNEIGIPDTKVSPVRWRKIKCWTGRLVSNTVAVPLPTRKKPAVYWAPAQSQTKPADQSAAGVLQTEETETPSGLVWAWGDLQTPKGPAAKGLIREIQDVVAVAAGSTTLYALTKSGDVWAWGHGPSRLGAGTEEDQPTPVRVKGLSEVTAISASFGHCLALKRDGTVWAWGHNLRGQLGDGSREKRNVPVQVKGIKDVVAVSAGRAHSCALRSDGTVWAWGDNASGQCAESLDVDHYLTPVQMAGLSDVVAISNGYTHNLALRKDGTVWQWGHPLRKLSRVPQLDRVKSIAAGAWFALALKEDGTLWAWGRAGQAWQNVYVASVVPPHPQEQGVKLFLPAPNRFQQLVPHQVMDWRDVTLIAAESHGVVARKDGSVWEWGKDYPLRRLREIQSPLALSTSWNMSLALIGKDQVSGIETEPVDPFAQATAKDVPALIKALKDIDANTRLSAARALNLARVLNLLDPEATKEAADALVYALCQDDDPSVLGSVRNALPAVGSPAVPALMKALTEPSTRVQVEVAYVLGRMGPTARDAIPALREASRDQNERVRKAAEWALEQILPPAKSAPQVPDDGNDTPDAAATGDTRPAEETRPGGQPSTRSVLPDTVKPDDDGRPEDLTTARAKKLKASLDRFKLIVTHRGGPLERNPGDMLTLTVNEARGVRQAQISRAEAETILDYLAEAEHLANARDVTQHHKIRYPPGPTCTLELHVPNLWLLEDLAWGPPMLKRLDGLRGVLEGEGAKTMDRLLEGLEPQRIKWQRGAAMRGAGLRRLLNDLAKRKPAGWELIHETGNVRPAFRPAGRGTYIRLRRKVPEPGVAYKSRGIQLWLMYPGYRSELPRHEPHNGLGVIARASASGPDAQWGEWNGGPVFSHGGGETEKDWPDWARDLRRALEMSGEMNGADPPEIPEEDSSAPDKSSLECPKTLHRHLLEGDELKTVPELMRKGDVTVSDAAGKQVGRRPAGLDFNTLLREKEIRVVALFDLSHAEYGIDKPGKYSVGFDGVPKKPNLVALPASEAFAFEVRGISQQPEDKK